MLLVDTDTLGKLATGLGGVGSISWEDSILVYDRQDFASSKSMSSFNPAKGLAASAYLGSIGFSSERRRLSIFTLWGFGLKEASSGFRKS